MVFVKALSAPEKAQETYMVPLAKLTKSGTLGKIYCRYDIHCKNVN